MVRIPSGWSSPVAVTGMLLEWTQGMNGRAVKPRRPFRNRSRAPRALPGTPDLDLRALLRADQALLEQTFGEAEIAARARDRERLQRAWTNLERLFLARVSAVETHLLPALEGRLPGEAAAVREEHARLHGQLCELGVGLDLHLVSSPVLHAFVSDLRAHARRETHLSYRSALINLPPEIVTAWGEAQDRGNRARHHQTADRLRVARSPSSRSARTSPRH
jgi:hypothetical protein